MRRVQHTPSNAWVSPSSCCEGTTSRRVRTGRRTPGETDIWTVSREREKQEPEEGRQMERERSRTSGCNTALEGMLHLAICKVSAGALASRVAPQGLNAETLSCKTSKETIFRPKLLRRVYSPRRGPPLRPSAAGAMIQSVPKHFTDISKTSLHL